MTHALADVVLVEHFRIWCDAAGIWPALVCPDATCPWVSGSDHVTLGQLLTAARCHISEAHPGGDPLSHEHAYTAVLHAVDNLTGDPYPLALIAEEQVPADDAAMRVCEATGNSVRGPLLPYEADGVRRWICRVCFAKCRRNASHVADPLPMPDGAP
jgi:hypothetical protein